MTGGGVDALLTDLHRRDYGRLVAALTRRFGGDLDLAEESLQDAFIAAATQWTEVPPSNPSGWLYRAASFKAIDRIRRERRFDELRPLLAESETLAPEDYDAVDEVIADERLRMLFMCCSPVLSVPAQLALTLQVIGGLTTAEIARGLLAREPAVAQRIVRAKRRLRGPAVPFSVPADSELCDRLAAVLGVINLIFTEGHSATRRASPIRVDLCREAIRLGGQLVDLMPDEPEAIGLLALMYLTDARRPGRLDAAGHAIALSDQDRRRWNRRELRRGAELLERALRRRSVGPYQLQAAVAAVHGEAPAWEDTDWAQIVALYAELETLTGSPVVRLNRAVALSNTGASADALELVETLADDLNDYQPWYAARADLLERVGRTREADAAYHEAIGRATNDADRALLEGRRRRVGDH